MSRKADHVPVEKTSDFDRPDVGNDVKVARPSSVSTVPDGGWGWIVVLGTFMIHVISHGVFYSFGIFVEDFVNYFDCSRSAVGGIGSLMLGVTWGSGNEGLFSIVSTVIHPFAITVHETNRD